MKLRIPHSAFRICVLFVGVCSVARADVLIYDAPTVPPLKVTLQGKVQVNPGKTVSFKHPLGTLYFGLEDVKYYEVPTVSEQFDRRFNKAKLAKDVDEVFQ